MFDNATFSEAQDRLILRDTNPLNGQRNSMYVVVHSESGHIFGFGRTPKKAMEHYLRGLLSYDGPPLDTRRCSAALYRRLQALERKGEFFIDCRINRDGVAVCPKSLPKLTRRRKH
jgi:hypothetical protein